MFREFSTSTNNQITYKNLASEALAMKADLMRSVEKVLLSGKYVMGEELSAFEAEFADYCDANFACGVDNGTNALVLALRTLGVGPGDEVITVPNSFIATASSICLLGARPVFVDVREDGNMDPDLIERVISNKTKVILPVHLTGRPARMFEILEIAKQKRIEVVEDAAQAVGAKLNGVKAGNFTSIACFSLHPLKTLHAYGDGGIVTCRNEEYLARLRKLRNHGLRNRECCEEWGLNARLDELHAAMLRVQMKTLDLYNEKRRELAKRFNKLLIPFVQVPDEHEGEYNVYQSYVIRSKRRDLLQRFLGENGVQTLVHYKVPIHLQPAAKSLGYTEKDFPVTMRLSDEILSLPIYPTMTKDEQNKIVDLISRFSN